MERKLLIPSFASAFAAAALSLAAPAAAQTVVLNANFEGGAQGFAYVDDAFRATAQPANANGVHLAAGGASGGGLQVKLAGTATGTITGVSGGWRIVAGVPANDGVQISFRYRLSLTAPVDADELGQVLMTVNGSLVGAAPNDYIAQRAGGPGTVGSWTLYTATLPAMPTGPLTLTLGAFQNKRTTVDEEVEVLLDDVTITAQAPAAVPANGLAREYWGNLAGNTVTSLTSSPAYPGSPTWSDHVTAGFETPSGFGNTYGVRLRGYVHPPATGAYTFWIAADDAAELWLSTSADPTAKTLIASSPTWVGPRAWGPAPRQSAAITLTGGQKYYVEALHKEGTGNDNLAVGWQGPGITGETERPIPVSRLTPWTGVQAPVIASQPASLTVRQGDPAAFSVTATGTEPLTYQWQRNGTDIPGATSSTYGLAATPGDDGAQFRAIVSNTAGSATSDAAVLTVIIRPVITVPPASQAVNLGARVVFGVSATGTAPFTYQWRRDGVDIAGATQNSFEIASVGSGDDGDRFDVVVGNAAGTATSAQALLTVRFPPAITAQPLDRNVNEGQAATFTVAATGTQPLAFQWRKNGVNLAGANSSSYATPLAVPGDNGNQYDVVVSNVVDAVTSAAATLTVNAAPVIVTPPQSQAVDAGTRVEFTVSATGAAPLAYQWQRNGVNLAGETGDRYVLDPAAAGDNGAQFRVIVTNMVRPVTSAAAILTVRFAPIITAHPQGATVVENTPVTLSVAASGTAPLAYQWRKDGVDLPGKTASTCNLGNVTLGQAGSYDAVVTNALGSASSNPATLVVNPAPPVFTTQPNSPAVTEGQRAAFTVAVTSSTPVTYQWRRNGIDIPGTNSNAYETPVTTPDMDGDLYSVVATNAGGPRTSGNGALTVRSVPRIVTHPSDRDAKEGHPTTFTVVASGTGPLSYAWQRNGAPIPGATSASYTVASVQPGDHQALFRVQVGSPYGAPALSNEARLTVQLATVQNRKLAISGELVDNQGNPVGYPTPVTVDAVVRLMSDATGGTAAYTEEFRAANQEGLLVENGLFVARLGEGTTTGDLQQVVTGNAQLWVEVTIDDGTPDVLQPRTPLTASAYALGGVPAPQPRLPSMQGLGSPNAQGVEALVGTFYVNGEDNTTWLKLNNGWKLMD